MSTETFLHALQQQVRQLATEIANTHSTSSAQARFDQQLFQCRSTHLRDYLAEVQTNLSKLNTEVRSQHTAQVAFLAERLLAQITALQRELATFSLRKQESVRVEKQDIYQRLAQYQDYERRLQAMIQDREDQLKQPDTLTHPSQTQREIAALEGRLSRCRQALQRLERHIEKRESGYFS